MYINWKLKAIEPSADKWVKPSADKKDKRNEKNMSKAICEQMRKI